MGGGPFLGKEFSIKKFHFSKSVATRRAASVMGAKKRISINWRVCYCDLGRGGAERSECPPACACPS